MSEHSVAEVEGKLSDLIDRALTGEDVVITREGLPVVELRPVTAAKIERSRMTPAEIAAWLQANRVGTRMPEEDAGTLICRLRDEAL
jgi:prevent-host-death family protein